MRIELEPPEHFTTERINSCLAATRSLVLEDGRKLAYLELGDPAGTPLFFFHGLPGSRVEALALDGPGRRLGFRVIAADRPGIGASDPRPQSRLLDWTADVGAMAEELEIGRFGVIGVSGGGPFAAACAYALPARLLFAIDVSGSAPLWTDPASRHRLSTLDRVSSLVGSRLPAWVLWATMSFLGWRLRRAKGPRDFVKLLGNALSPADRELAQKGYGELLLRDARESYAGGSRAIAHEARLNYLDWGFRHNEIETPMLLVHGTEDRVVPLRFAHWKHDQLPHSRLVELEGCGHFAPLLNGGPLLEEILSFGFR